MVAYFNGWRWILAAVAFVIAACGSDDAGLQVENKAACIVEVAERLVACAEDNECEQGVARFAGFCYNEAPGDQLDICRGGQYFFEQPMKELAANHEVVANLDSRLKQVVLRSGEVYCQYNFN